MSLSLRPGHRVFVYGEAIDMRWGFNRLSMIVREKMQVNRKSSTFPAPDYRDLYCRGVYGFLP